MRTLFKIYQPQLLSVLKQGYSFRILKKDFLSGVTVAILSLSLCMQLAITSGASPLQGLYAGIISGFIVSIFGGSKVQISAPTAALIAVIYGMIQSMGYEALCVSGLIASLIIVCLSLLQVGKWIKFIPSSLIAGFSSGLGITLFIDQIKNFMGYTTQAAFPSNFLMQIEFYITNYSTISPATLTVGIISIGIIALVSKFTPQVPWAITSIIVISAACYFLDIPVETIRSKYGEISSSLPPLRWPSFTISLESLPAILQCSVNLALIICMESLISAVVGKQITGQDFKANMELLAQGISNFFCVLFGAIPTTGVVLLTAANARSGAITPISGLIRAFVLFILIIFFGKVVSIIPLVSLAVVLMIVSIEIINVPDFIRHLRGPILDVVVLLSSFFLTIFTNLSIAVFVGVGMGSFIFMRQMSKKSKAIEIKNRPNEKKPRAITKISKDTSIYIIQGALFFGNADIFTKFEASKIYIIDISEVPFIDGSGFIALEEFYKQSKIKNNTVYICGVNRVIFKQMKKFGLLKTIPKKSFYNDLDDLLPDTSS